MMTSKILWAALSIAVLASPIMMLEPADAATGCAGKVLDLIAIPGSVCVTGTAYTGPDSNSRCSGSQPGANWRCVRWSLSGYGEGYSSGGTTVVEDWDGTTDTCSWIGATGGWRGCSAGLGGNVWAPVGYQYCYGGEMRASTGSAAMMLAGHSCYVVTA